jgi:hypothetical protein
VYNKSVKFPEKAIDATASSVRLGYLDISDPMVFQTPIFLGSLSSYRLVSYLTTDFLPASCKLACVCLMALDLREHTMNHPARRSF